MLACIIMALRVIQDQWAGQWVWLITPRLGIIIEMHYNVYDAIIDTIGHR